MASLVLTAADKHIMNIWADLSSKGDEKHANADTILEIAAMADALSVFLLLHLPSQPQAQAAFGKLPFAWLKSCSTRSASMAVSSPVLLQKLQC